MDNELLLRDLEDALAQFRNHKDSNNVGSLSFGEKGIVAFLFRHYPVSATSGELSLAMNVGTGRIANALKSLEKKELILRKNDETDKRKVNVILTEKGYQRAKLRRKQMKDFFYSMMDEYGEKDFSLFISQIRRYQKFVSEYINRKEKIHD